MKWESPVLRTTAGMVVIDSGDDAGEVVVPVKGIPCWAVGNGGVRCGKVMGHLGKHWECSPELVERDGPFAVVRPSWRRSIPAGS